MERAFIAKEYPIGSPDDPFDRRKIENQIASRMNHSSYPNQGGTSLCGPAAFFYCLQMDRSDVYKQAANELWLHGKTKIGTLDITPGDGCRHPKGKFYDDYGRETVSGLDWMTLASLRDSENSIMSYDEVDDQVAGITMWGKMLEWFVKAGYEKVFDNISLSHENMNDILSLNNYASKGVKVVSLISAGMLSDFPGDSSSKNHWIVWNSQVKNVDGNVLSNSTSGTDKVDLILFSWGEAGSQLKSNVNLNSFMKHTFGGLVFRPIK